MARRFAAVLALTLMAAVKVPPQRVLQPVNAGLFASLVTKAVHARKGLGSGPKVVVVIAMEESAKATALVSALANIKTMLVKAVFLTTREKRYLHALEVELQDAGDIDAIVVHEPDPHRAQAIAEYARDRHILTISSNQEYVDPMAMAVEESSNARLVYSDAALKAAHLVLESSFLQDDSVRRRESVEEPKRVKEPISTNTNLWQEYVAVREGLPRQANQKRKNRDFNEEIRTLQKAIRQAPGEYDVTGAAHFLEYYHPHYDLGRALWAAGDCECALKEWRRSEQLGYITRVKKDALDQFKARCSPPEASATPRATPAD